MAGAFIAWACKGYFGGAMGSDLKALKIDRYKFNSSRPDNHKKGTSRHNEKAKTS
jgi:hypothetical protein